jgi:2-polyprenyl-3-methyl-5-hydroxy-6-metoxy-1,4-benzoquinol methylase
MSSENLVAGRAPSLGTDNSELVWTREMIRRFWDYEKTRPENYFSFQVGRVITRRFRSQLVGRVVDYGAGTGFLLEELLAAGVQCGAVEFGDDVVNDLSNRFATRKGFLGARNNEDLAQWNGTFDAAFLLEVVEHLYEEDLQDCLSTVRSLLKPGGSLIVTTPNEEDRSKSFICSPESGLLFHRFQHVRSWSEVSLGNMLATSGFRVSQIGTTDFSSHPLAYRRTMSFPVRVARSAAKQLMKQTPHLYAVASRS